MELPKQGLPAEELFARLDEARAHDADPHSGRVFGYVYDAGQEVDEVARRAYTELLGVNALDFTVYPSMLRLENEVVGIAAAHLHGDEQVVGTFTTGGTESIILAVKTARDRARALRPDGGTPEMVLPVTAHAAFHKAAHYLGVRAVAVPVDAETYRVDLAAMEQAITDDTALLVASAPSYAHGVIDPVAELGELASARGLLLHVDACIGGFLLPYLSRLGRPVPPFDFAVPGVTSISMDLHKYAYAAKGASVVLYRDRQLRKHQLFACASWPGYVVVNATMQSTKTGGPLAAAWAVLHFLGDEGYLDLARRVLEGTDRIVAGIEAVEGLRVLGDPAMTLVAIGSDDVNLFRLADAMAARGWYIQPQLSYGDAPRNIHVTVNPSNVAVVEPFLADLRQCVEACRGVPPTPLAEMVGQAFANMAPGDLDEAAFSNMLGMLGISSSELPEGMAEINEILDILPPAVRERLLTLFVNDLFVPPSE